MQPKSGFSTNDKLKSQTEMISDAFRPRKCSRESRFLQIWPLLTLDASFKNLIQAA